ncbi:hypothetical protein HanRHA438_Chr03g0105821 [Helianthus annuus]|nr:hypothetical protein HanRHA438_Chr03g0105821 [Helianthus annuus]
METRFGCLRSESTETSFQNSTSPRPRLRSNLRAAIFINLSDRNSTPSYALPKSPCPMMLSS